MRDEAHELNRREFLAGASALLGAGVLMGASLQTQPIEQTMLMRAIPSSGESIPAVGMGTWQTFDVDPDDENALGPLTQVLRIFFDAGGRVIDTAPMYGRAEEVTGRLTERLKINERMFLATKVRIEGEQAGIEQMNRSMERLKRDNLELMQVHNLVDWRTQLKTMRAWKDAGKFRYMGITHWDARRFEEMERILRSEKVDFVQLPYSIAMVEAEKRLLPAAHETGTAVLVMRPFEGGSLFAAAREMPLPDFAKEFASSWAQVFLKFILAHPAVTCVIPATSKPHHMQDNIQAGFGRLPDDAERKRLVQVLQG